LVFLISIENFYFVEKQNKENFVKKFVESGIIKTCDELDLEYQNRQDISKLLELVGNPDKERQFYHQIQAALCIFCTLHSWQ
jgi:hypothetical protein